MSKGANLQVRQVGSPMAHMPHMIKAAMDSNSQVRVATGNNRGKVIVVGVTFFLSGVDLWLLWVVYNILVVTSV